MRLPGAVLAVGAALIVTLVSAGSAAGGGVGGNGNDRWIVNKIGSMTLEEKVGQLFVANVYGSVTGWATDACP